MGKWTEEELTCPECAAEGTHWVAKNPNGLRGHRQFKHGVLPSSTGQLPLQQQDLLVSESKLEQLLDVRFAVISEQVDALNGELEQLQERLSAAEHKTIDDFTGREKAEFIIPWLGGLDAQDFFTLARETGHDVVPDPAVVAVLAETFQRQAEEAEAKGEEEPQTIKGKTTRKGYRYLEYLNLSVREKK